MEEIEKRLKRERKRMKREWKKNGKRTYYKINKRMGKVKRFLWKMKPTQN